MKKFLFVYLLLASLLACSKRNNYKDEIIGKWKVDSALYYYNGEEKIIRVSEKENIFTGSYDNPRYCNFTKYGEAFFYRLNDQQKRMSKFDIKGDSILYQSITGCKILNLTHNNLVFQQELEIDYFDKSIEHSKKILTLYFTKED